MTAEDFLKSDEEAAPAQSAADFLNSDTPARTPDSLVPYNPDIEQRASDIFQKLRRSQPVESILGKTPDETSKMLEPRATGLVPNVLGLGPSIDKTLSLSPADLFPKKQPTVAAGISRELLSQANLGNLAMVTGIGEVWRLAKAAKDAPKLAAMTKALIGAYFASQGYQHGVETSGKVAGNPNEPSGELGKDIADIGLDGLMTFLPAGEAILSGKVKPFDRNKVPISGSSLKTPEGAKPLPPEQGPAHAEFIVPPDLESKSGIPSAPSLPIDPRLQSQLDAVDISPAPDIQKAILDKKIKSPIALQRVFPGLNLTVDQAQEVLNRVNKTSDTVSEQDRDKSPIKPLKGDKIVTIQRPDGTTYPASYGGKTWNLPSGESPGVARIVNGKWSHAWLRPGEKILDVESTEIPAAGQAKPPAAEPKLKSSPAISVDDPKVKQEALLLKSKLTTLSDDQASKIASMTVEDANKALAAAVENRNALMKGGHTDEYDNAEDYASGLLWKAQQKPLTESVKTEPVPNETESQSPTGIKNATVDAERAARGLPSAIQPAKRSFGAVWDEAMSKLDKNPTASQDLVDSLRGNPRALTDAEDALLLHRQIELQNEYGKVSQDLAKAHDEGRSDDVPELRVRAAAISDALLDLYDIGKSSGSETGRGLNARKMMANEDYSLAQMEVSKRAANGGQPLDEKQSKEIKDLHDQISKTQKAYDDYVANMQVKISAMESERATSDILKSNHPVVEPNIRILADKIIAALDKQAESALQRIRDRRGQGQAFSGAPINPETIDDYIIYGAAKITKGAIEFGKWSSEMVSDLGEYVKPHLKDIWGAANKSLDKTIEKSVSPVSADKVKRTVKSMSPAEQQNRIQATIRTRVQSGQKNEITPQVQKLARIFVAQGIKTRDELIDAVHGVLKGIDPEMTRRDAMDAISGYGDFKPITKDQISVELRDLKGQMQQVAKLEDMRAGQPPLKTGMERRIPSKEESRLIKLVNDAKRKFQIPITDPNTQLRSSLDELKKRMQSKTDELEKKLADGDFATRTRPEPVKLDAEGLKLKADNERAKQAFNHGLQLDRLKNRTWLEKAQDTLVRWRRGFLLSSPVTLAKLTAAAIQRMTITPLEEAVGAGYSKALPRIAEKAPREGGFNSKAEAKSFVDAITKGMKDSWDVLRTGQSQLDVLFGQGREGYVSENFVLPSSVIDFFGHVHGALKSPVKRAEFSRSLEKRTEQAVRAGVDVSDPLVQTRLMMEAYKDANRSIFLQNNRVTSAYRAAVRTLEQKDKVTGRTPVGSKALATAAKVILPIVKVPTNIIAETFQYSLGTITGGTRLALALRRGVENLKPDEADLILRDLKKGSIGAAVLLLGYFNPDVVGGYYQQGQKRKEGDVKYGSLKIYGVNIPSVLLHNPLLETLQVGATVRRVQDSKLRKKDKDTQGLPSGIAAGALGLTEEVPFVNDMLQLSKTFNPRERNQFWGEYSKSMVVPQLVQFIANNSDSDRLGNPVTRNPTNTIQHIETGIPGFRQDVPIKKK